VTTLLLAADDETVEVDVEARTVEGLLVPFGQTGYSHLGLVSFAADSIELPADISRVKFLDGHDQKISLGEATELRQEADGLYVKFSVAEGEAGDRALADIKSGARDGLSAGIRLSDATVDGLADQLMADGPRTAVAAGGLLLEGSLVSIPAFADARANRKGKTLAASAESGTIAMFGWGTRPEKNTPTEEITVAEPTETTGPVVVSNSSAPAVVTAEAPVYTFNGAGPSLMQDLGNSAIRHDSEAGERVAKFNAALRDGDYNATRTLELAVATRATGSSAAVLPEVAPIRRDLLLEEINRGRPLTDAFASNFALTDATPFRVPTGPVKFNSVGDHVEGTAHVTEGVLTTVTSQTVTPGAISGAYRFSRELLDASNPAIDSLALDAMISDYRRASEAKVAAEIAANGGTAVASINTVQKLRLQANAFYDVEDVAADFIIESGGFFATQISDLDSTNRPILPYIGPANASGQLRPGYTGYSLDGADVTKSNSIAANTAIIARKSAMVVAESAVRTFKFEEVEGPGVIKVALFGYFVAKVVAPSRIKLVKSVA